MDSSTKDEKEEKCKHSIANKNNKSYNLPLVNYDLITYWISTLPKPNVLYFSVLLIICLIDEAQSCEIHFIKMVMTLKIFIICTCTHWHLINGSSNLVHVGLNSDWVRFTSIYFALGIVSIW